MNPVPNSQLDGLRQKQQQQQQPQAAVSWNEVSVSNNTSSMVVGDPTITTSGRTVHEDTYFPFEDQMNELNIEPIPFPELQNGNHPHQYSYQAKTTPHYFHDVNQQERPLPSTITFMSSANSVVSEMTTGTTTAGFSKKRNHDEETRNRTVNDYDNEDDLFNALLATIHPPEGVPSYESLIREIADGQPVQKVARYGEKVSEELIQNSDWILPRFDAATTEPQTVQDEVRRLQTLQKYFVLDSQRDEAFDRITSLAARIFDVPISLISLIDLGREWFLSNYGLGDAKELPRKMAICAHAILNKDNMLIIPDATQDFRFHDHPAVTGFPNVRFYAGVPIIAPEGDKLGTICIVDNVPRPEGLTDEQKLTLRDLADMVIKVMVDRRYQLEKQNQQDQLKKQDQQQQQQQQQQQLQDQLKKQDQQQQQQQQQLQEQRQQQHQQQQQQQYQQHQQQQQYQHQQQQQPLMMENNQLQQHLINNSLPQQEMSMMIPPQTTSQPQSLQYFNQLSIGSSTHGLTTAASATVQEMMTPLSGLQLSLSLLKEDEPLCASMNDQQRTLLNTAVSCAEFLMGLCEKNLAGSGTGSTSNNTSGMP